MSSNPPSPADDGGFRLLFEHSSDARLIFDAGVPPSSVPASVHAKRPSRDALQQRDPVVVQVSCLSDRARRLLSQVDSANYLSTRDR
jgi:hypothetical protein